MKRSYTSNGSILVLALFMLSLMTLLTQQLLHNVYVSSHFIQTMLDRERAEMMAISGISIALAQIQQEPLEQDDAEQKEEKTQQPESGEDEEEKTADKTTIKAKKLLRTILPHLNCWQVFNFTEKTDGITGNLKLCICCENGKINLNEAFNFKTQEFHEVYADMLKSLAIKGKLEPGELYEKVLEFFKMRRKKLYDVSELYEIKEFEKIDIFYKPPTIPEGREKAERNSGVTLQDIFTIWTDDLELEPLLLSDSLRAFLQLRRPTAGDAMALKDQFKQTIDAFTLDAGANLEENWKIFEPIFGEKPAIFEKIQGIFKKRFEPKVFSVLSYGNIGEVEQRLLAIIKEVEVTPETKDDAKKTASEEKESFQEKAPDAKQKKPKRFYKVIRAYWL